MLKGKNAIVTGGRRGIGRAIVECLASYGANIWAHARKEDADFEKDMASMAEKYGVWIKPVYFDLTDDEQIKSGIKSILGEKLPVDILVNNAGVAHGGLLQMVSIDDMKKVFDINYFAQMRIIQLLIRKMSKQQSGCIINMSSVEGLIGNAGNTAYGASKAALCFATKTLAKELAPSGIRVNAIAPGLVDTDMGAMIGDEPKKAMMDMCAFHRLGTPYEIAETVAFLADDKASFITGQIIRVDGGM